MVLKFFVIVWIDGVLNVVVVDGDFVGEVILVGLGVGGNVIVFFVVVDIVDVVCGDVIFVFGMLVEDFKVYECVWMCLYEGGYYIWLFVYDWFGVFVEIV